MERQSWEAWHARNTPGFDELAKNLTGQAAVGSEIVVATEPDPTAVTA